MKNTFADNLSQHKIQQSIWDTEERIEALQKRKHVKAMERSPYQSIAWEIAKKYKFINPKAAENLERDFKRFSG